MAERKRPFRNRLNDMTPKEWIKFQKSWFIHNPPPRRKKTRQHPAKFPETLAQEFIEFFTKSGETVLDPMAGTGSALVAGLRSGRHSYGIELNPEYAAIGREILKREKAELDAASNGARTELFHGDARDMKDFNLPPIDYVITSPPYWNMLHARGAETQKERRGDDDLDVIYSDSEADLGNIDEYSTFLDELVSVYRLLPAVLKDRAYVTIIVKNIKKGGAIYPLAWDLARRVGEFMTLKDEKIWCQDNVRLAPYGMGNAWVSNTFHHYCLQFRNEVTATN